VGAHSGGAATAIEEEGETINGEGESVMAQMEGKVGGG